jgi:hypothetical protein
MANAVRSRVIIFDRARTLSATGVAVVLGVVKSVAVDVDIAPVRGAITLARRFLTRGAWLDCSAVVVLFARINTSAAAVITDFV